LIRTRLETVDQEKMVEIKNAALYQLQSEFKALEQEDEFLGKQIRELQNRQERIIVELGQLTERNQAQSDEANRLRGELTALREKNTAQASLCEQLRVEHADRKRDYDLAVENREEINQDLARIKSRLVRLEESITGKERLAQQHADRQEEVLAENDQIQTEIEYWRRQEEELALERATLNKAVAAAKTALDSNRQEATGYQKEADRLLTEERNAESRLAGLSSRLATLRDLRAQFSLYPEGVQALMAWSDREEAGIIGPLAERLAVPLGFEKAMEAALGERLGYVLVRERGGALRAIEYLTAGQLGRCGLIVLDNEKSLPDSDLVEFLLGDLVLTDTLTEAALEPSGRNILTKSGEYIGASGLMVGGQTRQTDHGLLQRLREIDELEDQVKNLTETRRQLADERLNLTARIEQVRKKIVQDEDHLRQGNSQIVEIDKKLSALTARRREHERRAGTIVRLLENQAEEARLLAEEKEAARAEIDALISQEETIGQELALTREQALVMAAELEAISTKGHKASAEMNAGKERFGAAERELTRVTKWLEEIIGQIKTKTREQEDIKVESEQISRRRQAIVDLRAGFLDRLSKAEEDVASARRLLDEMHVAANNLEKETRQTRKQREEANEQIKQVELDLQEIGFRQKSIQERLQTDYLLDIEHLPTDIPQGPGADFDVEEAGHRKEDLKTKIEAMGEVNLTAIGEHEALLERYNFYRDQYDDLTRAINNLRDSIAKINRTCKIRFNSTFKAVDEKLREIFPLLFDGGEAWLSLTDESDPLESGVEIHVHPPGKKLTVMSLLSGGEKALVALALIFSLYLIKPSPFCLLDETDAPLDEANIDRFNRLLTKLGQSSQIIMVTHNKRTMQISQTLYGVTMESPGVSKMVSVNLSQMEKMEEHVQMVQAG
ncbi:MAG: AAA family ATPase, partial [Deltaproteobacteria bacterium]|nr:AAA family ATPase [Deltaproteobacteria bacterium]